MTSTKSIESISKLILKKWQMIQHFIYCTVYDACTAYTHGISVYKQFFFFVLLFRAAPAAYASSQARGQIGAIATGLCHSHSNTRSLTHWMRPGIEPAPLWILVGFVTTEPQEFPINNFKDTSSHWKEKELVKIKVWAGLGEKVKGTNTIYQQRKKSKLLCIR